MKDTDSNTMESSFASGDFAELPERPTKVRYGVLAFLAAMTFILYLDRVCIGQSATAIKRDLGISDVWMSWVFNAFIISYTTLEIPTGRWGDRYGSRSVLARVVVWWSCFTALTGAAASLTMLLTVRFLFGAGEAGALPNAARVLKEWFPESSRGRAQGMITTAMMIGGAVSPPVAQRLINAYGWRWTFVVFGLTGLAWAIGFYLWFRDDPAEHPGTNLAERLLIKADGDPTRKSGASGFAAHEPIPWTAVFRNKNIWLLSGTMITMSGVYMLMTYWYPTYLQEGRAQLPICRAGSRAWSLPPVRPVALSGAGSRIFCCGRRATRAGVEPRKAWLARVSLPRACWQACSLEIRCFPPSWSPSPPLDCNSSCRLGGPAAPRSAASTWAL